MATIIRSKKEILKAVDEMLEDMEYKLKHAKSPKSKRSIKHTHDFFASIKHHLTKVGKTDPLNGKEDGNA